MDRRRGRDERHELVREMPHVNALTRFGTARLLVFGMRRV